ncbi:MAG: type II secretion system F family protein [Bacilli bacterium]|nr:type II secretion system F family protein [Bacilli bacterium]
MDINPAFQVSNPGYEEQSQSLIEEPPVQNLIESQQVVAPEPVQPVDQPPLVTFDPVTGAAMTEQAAVDPVTGLPVAEPAMAVDPAAMGQVVGGEQMAVDPVTGLPIAGAAGAVMDQSAVDPVTGLPIAGAQSDYNNAIPGGNPDGSAVQLPEEASVIAEGKEKVRRETKRFMYTIINSMGKKEKGPFEAETEEDVRNFLLSQDYQILEVKERSSTDIDIGGNGKISAGDLSFCLTQLSTYLKSGIALSDAVRILAKQSNKANLKHHFNQLVYELLKGESLSGAMELQDTVFPKLLVNMVKTAEMTGDLPAILDDMAEYYTSMDQTKKQMKSAMTYPAVVLTIAFGVLIFMLTYLVPQFTAMFEEQGAQLPALTEAIVHISAFIREKWYVLIIIAVVVVATFAICYINILGFRRFIQVTLMHMPVVGNIIIYNEMANFAKTFASLLNHSVFITDSMEILSKITNNEIYKSIINDTLEHLSKGDSISSSFKGQWAIPIVAYEMIVTGESTGQLGAMMEKVANHFQMLHKNVIDQMKSLVEPIMICFLAVVVGIILVAIIQPMFSIYSQIK